MFFERRQAFEDGYAMSGRIAHRLRRLALQLQFQVISESMGDPGSEIMDGGRFDRDDTGALGVIAA
jgi:hypothetical protein